MMTKTFIVRYNEIALKGNNRGDFVTRLMTNIQRALGLRQKDVLRRQGQIVVRVPPDRVAVAHRVLPRTAGIAWYAETITCKGELEFIERDAYQLVKDRLDESTSFAVDANRADKTVPFTSHDINRAVGAIINRRTGAPVDLDTPDVTVYIDVRPIDTFIFTEKISGPGGLPTGTSGRVLTLLSGGFDSMAAAYYLARRGACVDFLHFYALRDVAEVADSKMPDLWRRLAAFTQAERIFLINYAPYQLAVLDRPLRYEKVELVVFRRLMARVGERLAQQHGYDALVMGDSLGQVASQTLPNITAVDAAVDVSIFRPLIGIDKHDVVDLIAEMGLWEAAVADYKDCCAIISRHPSTQAQPEKIAELEALIDVEKLVDRLTHAASRVDIQSESLATVAPPPA